MQHDNLIQRADSNAREKDSIFIVHGRDDNVKLAVTLFLERFGLIPIILNEQINRGKTIIEKFEEFAKKAKFAVVLLTPDDKCHAIEGTEVEFRARQNVIYELGYFSSALGRANTFVIKKGNIDIPSDMFGIVYEPFETENWRLKLAKELKAAGYQIDLNKL